MGEIEKLDNVTWYGHCVIQLMAALNDLPDQASSYSAVIWRGSSGTSIARCKRPPPGIGEVGGKG